MGDRRAPTLTPAVFDVGRLAKRPARRGSIGLAIVVVAALWAAAGCTGLGPTPVCLAGSSMGAGQTCRTRQAPAYHIPFRRGFETKVVQGFYGYLSHKEDLAYSVDFRCPSATPVAAAKAGRVWAVRDDSDKGCADPSCVKDANYVILDHGDGTYSEYYHLRQFGALVDPGEQVCAGQIIGLSGNTGYSSGPHLHFAVTDATRHTLPFRLAEAAQTRDYGFPVPETHYTSTNALHGTCEPTDFSGLSRAAFAHQGIVLSTRLPAVIDDPDQLVGLEGIYHGDHPNVAIHRKRVDGDDWVDECVAVDDDGHFAANLQWPRRRFRPGTYWFMITGADEDCLSPGWAWSYKVQIFE